MDCAVHAGRGGKEVDRTVTDSTVPAVPQPAYTTEQLTTLFALGREVTSVLDLNELLHKIPQLIARLTHFRTFAVYLLDSKRDELTIAYSVGYAEDVARTLRVKAGHGLVVAAAESG